jgi:hypothetical protein
MPKYECFAPGHPFPVETVEAETAVRTLSTKRGSVSRISIATNHAINRDLTARGESLRALRHWGT